MVAFVSAFDGGGYVEGIKWHEMGELEVNHGLNGSETKRFRLKRFGAVHGNAQREFFEGVGSFFFR